MYPKVHIDVKTHSTKNRSNRKANLDKSRSFRRASNIAKYVTDTDTLSTLLFYLYPVYKPYIIRLCIHCKITL